MVIANMLLLVLALVIIQRMVYERNWCKGLDMRLRFSAREAFEGERLTLFEDVTNAKRLPLPWLRARFQLSRNLVFEESQAGGVSDLYTRADMFSIGMYQHIVRRRSFVCAKRGYYRVRHMDLISSDVLGTRDLVLQLDSDAELTVFPGLLAFDEVEVLFRQLFGQLEVLRFTNPDPFAFRGIREYQQHDDFRLINFKASAISGQLMVNQTSGTTSQELVLLLNLEPYSAYPRDRVREAAIRMAATVAQRFTAAGLPVGLASNGRDVVTGEAIELLPGSGNQHLYSLLHGLARIDLGAGQSPMQQLMAGQAAEGPLYLLISSNNGPEMQAAYAEMLARGLHVRWVVPLLAEEKMDVAEDGRITRWEVQ